MNIIGILGRDVTGPDLLVKGGIPADIDDTVNKSLQQVLYRLVPPPCQDSS